jgi:F-type H+-transporting ATPase subunit b
MLTGISGTFAFVLAAGSPLEASPLGIGIWVIVAFLCLFALLYKTAWPKLLSALEERENAIRQQLEDAQQKQQKAAALVEERLKELEKVKDEARALLEEERSQGQKMRQDIVTRAREEATQIVEKARQEIEFEREKAVESLRREAVDLSLDAASRVLGRSITDEDHRRLVEEAIAELGKLKA